GPTSGTGRISQTSSRRYARTRRARRPSVIVARDRLVPVFLANQLAVAQQPARVAIVEVLQVAVEVELALEAQHAIRQRDRLRNLTRHTGHFRMRVVDAVNDVLSVADLPP